MSSQLLSLVEQQRPIPNGLPMVSIVVPFFNESKSLEACHNALVNVLDSLQTHCEIVYIDDGSSDDSWRQVCSFRSQKHQISRIKLSRNFGKEAALSAGLKASNGRAVIPFDADLQDPPEYIPKMIDAWQAGADIVEMKRSERLGESTMKKTSAKLFYKILNLLSDIELSENVGDFRLLDKRVVDVINSLPERSRYMKGLLSWPGFKRKTLLFNRNPRQTGESKWNYFALLHLAFEGITSFSIKPLRLATIAGVLTSFIALSYALITLCKTLIYGDPVAGYPTLEITMLFLGGVQLLCIGLLGEYIGRLFIESKQRPLYVIMDKQLTSPCHQTAHKEEK
ncbi:glycosyltransferase [Marinomonas mediterranea]|uniref:glycosyltransferase family 2 protein n=1 Tax=Marinomonas mediterranea TaxID=119864 RepID=UPI00234C0391|nr:glycosyltransferase family 2 protein [Marinomonas mediterranea]WCN12879.1 glycosyltransferase [Marinomonas mediterranea]